MKNLVLGTALALLSFNAIPQVVEEKLPIYCSTTDSIFSALKNQYKEAPIGIGRGGDAFITIWSNKDTKTFTIVITAKNKTNSCIAISGENFSSSLQGSEIKNEKPSRSY